MTRAVHGLVIGKFYPPHEGHHLLVRTAAAASDRVTVVVMASMVESIALDERVAWMREAHTAETNVSVIGVMDELPVDFESDEIWQGHVSLMLDAARTVTSTPVDAVFTSESYGEELARRLCARHVPVDPAREFVPISGTRVRARPADAWPFLSIPVRRGLALRVVLVGAESTGKTTLARALAEAIRGWGGPFALTAWIPEYGREWSIEKLTRARAQATLAGAAPPNPQDVTWETDDFVRVARMQTRREDDATAHAPIVVADTDAFATGIWHERYMACRAANVDALAPSSTRRLYLVTHHDDVPFIQDGLRDGEHLRAWMTDAFVKSLDQQQRTWHWLRGISLEQRVARALELVTKFEAEAWRFAAPLG